MNLELFTYITLTCTSGVLNLFLSLYVFFKRHQYTSIASLFIAYTLLISIYCFGTAFGLMSETLGEIKFWTVILYIGMPFSAPVGLLFVMQYLGINALKKRYLSLLIIPLVTFLMVATNDFHQLYYRVYEVDPVLGAPYVYQEVGIWYLVHGITTFSSMFVALYLLMSHWRDIDREYRQQLAALMLGQFIPMVTAFIYLIGLTPPGIDPVPVIMWVSSILYLWAIGYSRLFRIMPIAKTTIFNSINDGVIVLDSSRRLIEYNQTTEQMFPQLTKAMFGHEFNIVWKQLAGEPFPFQAAETAAQQELQLSGADGHSFTYQVRSTPLHHGLHHKGQLLIFTDITEVKVLQLKLEHLAYYDELTQIYNRRAFFEHCKQHYTEAVERSLPMTVILMDIDHFKKVNDTYGHAVGDMVLKHMADQCKGKLGGDQLFGRYGGEEFVLALKNQDLNEGMKLAESLRQHIENHPFQTEETLLSITLSLGVATATHLSDESLFQLLNQADKALYEAKRTGRNKVIAYHEEDRIFGTKSGT
ncbi:diguanylate cyclase [Jeotgalibacillus alimentarius]|uniref:Diguanylate cyclase n=1 Tax=Jeotgalibacillus alimentarius TaxID=135826 RepID=A0A0C2VFJ3_9BACL|nr:diguanylate cyclase [Jeotgalibacillus alimentarius]KIL42788.1 diguanylate cyclase [Jeotgalibacillus alimentarius]